MRADVGSRLAPAMANAPRRRPRKARPRSRFVTIAGLLLLIPALFFTLGLIVHGTQLAQGPPRARIGPLGAPAQDLEDLAAGYRTAAFAFDLVAVLLLLPAAMTVLRRWRYSRVHGSVACLASIAFVAWGLITSGAKAVAGGQIILAVLWLAWAIFILYGLWRPSSAAEFQ